MKLLLIHADRFSYSTRDRTRVAEDISDKDKQGSMEELLVAFCAVEKTDVTDEGGVADSASHEIAAVLEQLGTRRVMVYPYAHLSPKLSPPDTAVRVLKSIASSLAAMGMEVKRSPFGWYKSFEISCKGHPLSELSRDISPGNKHKGGGKEESAAVSAEKKLVSKWFILESDGGLYPAEDYDFQNFDGIKRFFSYEHSKVRKDSEAPPHIKMMQSHELVDYEPGTDPGHFRYYPKGRMMKSLLEQYVTSRILDYGGMEVETPIMYDYEHPSLKSYLNRFPARQYAIDTPQKRVFLRFAACFGQFLMAHDATISYRNLPLRLYEMTRYSFRVEQRGELSGLRRLRAFTMPDCHALCADVEQAKEELLTRFHLAVDIQRGIGFTMPDDMELAIRVTKTFWEKNKDYVSKLVKEWGKPALVEMWDDQFFYFVMKYEFNFLDSSGKAAALTTDQIDVENAETYDITYTDRQGEQKKPVILHLSPSGAIERVIYALLEKQAGSKKPVFPLWLNPSQVRFIPVSEDYVEDCVDMARRMSNVRADVDNRDGTIGKKIREAEKDWVGFTVVYGEKEKESGSLAVRIRATGEQANMTLEEMHKKILEETSKYPQRPLPVPMMMSNRVTFRG